MTPTVTTDVGLLAGLEQVSGLVSTFGPPEWDQLRRAGLQEFEAYGIPTTKHEEWKYTSLRMLESTAYAAAYGANVYRPEIAKTPLGNLETVNLTFVNGQFAPELSTEHALPGGALVCNLPDAAETVPEIVAAHLGKLAGSKSGKLGRHLETPFVGLNLAHLSEGAFVYVPDGVALEHPIHIQFVTKAEHGPMAAYPRTLIVLGKAAQAKVVEDYVGLEGEYFNAAVTEISLGEDARLEHVRFQNETSQAIHLSHTQTVQDAGSDYAAYNVSFGAATTRNDAHLWLGGEHTESRLDGVFIGSGEQIVDNHTRIDHAKPNCNSHEVYKGILGGKATGVFNGKIFVYQDAQKTDAKQTNKALLLSPTASMNTKPQLEIFADDVKCTHGATVGQLSEEALFYLRARGVPKKQAEALLVYAFAAEVLERISMKAVAEALEQALYAKLSQMEE